MKKRYRIGTWMLTNTPAGLDVISKSGFDFVCIDLEHSSIGYEDLNSLLIILEKNKIDSFVRVSSNNQSEIKKVLDLGAKGIIVPMINSEADAIRAVKYTYYPNKGQRGVGLSRAQGYGYNFKNYLKTANKIKLILQIETINSIRNLEKILKVKGFNGTMIGPYDLSGSLGKLGKFNSKEFKNSILKYEKISKKYEKFMGSHIAYPEVNSVKNLIRKKYKFIVVGTDMTLLGEACRSLLKKII
tara:strand:- start:13781 stop:14509 length:729 start_codon:yes stop_codon:yes gene_type:complete